MKISRKKSKLVWLFFVWIIIQTGVVFLANAGDIIITEFFYNKSAGNLPEYVELFNKTESPIDLNGWKVQIDEYPVEIDVTFTVESHDYAVILNDNGKLRSEDTIYCSSSYDEISTFCNSPLDNLFWSYSSIFDLSSTSGTIKISIPSKVIDVVVYDMTADDMTADFPVGDDVLGRAAVFIIDPKSENAHIKNDDSLNWRSSEHPSEYLWNGSSRDFGSPMSSNFITPTILIDANSNITSDSTKNTVCPIASGIFLIKAQISAPPQPRR